MDVRVKARCGEAARTLHCLQNKDGREGDKVSPLQAGFTHGIMLVLFG
jgi:hypothetical protein